MQRFLYLLVSLVFSASNLFSQYSCNGTSYTLTAHNLNDLNNNVSSWTYNAATYSMPCNVQIQKVAGNGPNMYRYSSSTSLWIGKDDDVEVLPVTCNYNAEYADIVITFGMDVNAVSLDFGAVNNNSDGEEQIQNIYPQTAAGVNITTGVTYNYQPGVPNGTTTGTNFNNTTKTIFAYSGNADNGRLNISSATPFRKVRFRWKEISDCSYSGPNGILLKQLRFCPRMPEIQMSYNSLPAFVIDTLSAGTLNLGQNYIMNLIVTNTGNTTLNLSNLALSSNAQFQLLTASSMSVLPGQSSTIQVVYNPQSYGSHSALLTFLTNDPDEENGSIRLIGNTSGPDIVIANNSGQNIPSGGTVNAPPTAVGFSNNVAIVISNQGSSPLTISNITLGANPNWSLANISLPFTLGVGQQQTITVNFHPISNGVSNAMVTILSNDFNNSTYTVNLQGSTLSPTIITQSSCANQLPYSWHGLNITSTGTYNKLLTNTQGADSLLQLNFTVKQIDTVRISQSICNNTLPYQWNGLIINSSGTYTQTLTGSDGCDSITIMNLNILLNSFSSQSQTICASEFPTNWNGITITQAGTYRDTLVGSNSCDSIVTLNLFSNPVYADTFTLTICSSELPYTWNGLVYNNAGTQYINYQSSLGCDSIYCWILNVIDTSLSYESQSVCQNQLPYNWNGTIFTGAGTQSVTLTAANGCDSIVRRTLTIIPNLSNNLFSSVCSGQLPYTWNGLSFNSSGTQSVTYNSINNCDSVVNYNLSVISPVNSTENRTVCASQLPYLWNGIRFIQSGTQTATLLSSSGCDSIVTMNLSVINSVRSLTVDSIDYNQTPYSWNGLSLNQSGTYSVTLISSIGCDSFATLSLTVDNVPAIQVSLAGTFIPNYGIYNLPNLVAFSRNSFVFKVYNAGLGNLSVSAITENTSFSTIGFTPINAIQSGNNDSFEIVIIPAILPPSASAITVQINSNDPLTPVFSFKLIYKIINGPIPEIELATTNNTLFSVDTVNLVSTPTLVGQTSNYLLNVRNTGTADLILSNVFENISYVTIINNFSDTILPGSSTQIMLSYNPVQTGQHSGNLTINSNDADESTSVIHYIFRAHGVATYPEIELSYNNQQQADNSYINLGIQLASQTFLSNLVLTNTGNGNLIINSTALSNSVEFTVIGNFSGTVIAPGQQIIIPVRFNGAAPGNYNSRLSISNNDPNENPYDINFEITVQTPSLTSCSGCDALSVNSNPQNNSEWVDNMPKMYWQHDLGRSITYYKVEMWETDGSGNNVSLFRINGSNSVLVFPTNSHLVELGITNPLNYFTEYKWKVTAYSANHIPIACFSRLFTTMKRPAILDWTCPVPAGTVKFGTKLGQYNNIPIYKNGGCENGSYDSSSETLPNQYYNANFPYNQYGWQCAELPPRYFETRYNMTVGPGNGVDYYLITGNRKGFRRFENGNSTIPPKPEDILARNSLSHSAGHVVIAKSNTSPVNGSATAYRVRLIQQNAGSDINGHLNGFLNLRKSGGRYTITNSTQGRWLGWIRAVPEIVGPGDNNTIPVLNTTTPDFMWAKHGNIKGYNVALYKLQGSCYTEVSALTVNGNNFTGMSFPQLIPGETYKWTLENVFINQYSPSSWNKKIRSYAYYFKVAQNAQPTATQAPVVINGVPSSHFLIQTIASPVNGSEIYYKNNEDWLYFGNTQTNGSLFYESETIKSGDSLLIIRPGYYPLRTAVSKGTLLKKRFLFPMMEYKKPIVFKVNTEDNNVFVNADMTAFYISGSGFTRYKIFYGDHLFENDYSPSDSVFVLKNLIEGQQSIRFIVYNDTDSIEITKQFFAVSKNSEWMNLSFVNPKNEPVSLFLDDMHFTDLKESKSFTIPYGHYILTIKGHGSYSEDIEIMNDTAIYVSLKELDWINFEEKLTLNAGEATTLDAYMTILNNKDNSFKITRKRAENLDDNYEILSETVSLEKEIQFENESTKLYFIIDKKHLDENFLLHIVQNGSEKILSQSEFGDSISYDKEYQIIKFNNIRSDIKITPVLKKQTVEKNLVQNSELWLFPNPNKGVFSYMIDNQEGFAEVEVYDMIGRKLYSEQKNLSLNTASQIDTLGLMDGNYLLRVVVNNIAWTKKFVVSK